MGRPTTDWNQLTIFEKGENRKLMDYPFKQLIGIESRLQRTIKKKNEKIDALKDSIKNQIQNYNKEIMTIKFDLKNVRVAINEKSKEFDDSKFTILRGGKYVRAKIRIMGRVRWVHIGSSDEWAHKSDEDILKVCRSKVSKHFSKDRFKVK